MNIDNYKTIANNILIAEFMNIEQNDGCFLYDAQIGTEHIPPECLEYNDNWNWLMKVVEKIENFGYEFIIVESRCYVKHNTDHSIEEVFHMEGDVCSKLKTTYEAVVEFINQYNKNIIW